MHNPPKNTPFEAFIRNESPFFFFNQNVVRLDFRSVLTAAVQGLLQWRVVNKTFPSSII
jgi:hypothetical protein